MKIVTEHALLDEALDAFAGALGEARATYRGHAYRVFNYARAVYGSDAADDALAVAAAFHDLGIWSDGTFDYLAPSIARAERFLETSRRAADRALVREAIDQHHKLRRYRGATSPAAVEAFRLADRVDLTAGFARAGVARGRVREIVAAFPYRGFHGVIVRHALAWAVRHPLRPMPMLRF